jgi:hypothetical protein
MGCKQTRTVIPELDTDCSSNRKTCIINGATFYIYDVIIGNKQNISYYDNNNILLRTICIDLDFNNINKIKQDITKNDDLDKKQIMPSRKPVHSMVIPKPIKLKN